ncbi:MAG: hypothetical protein M3O98_03060 [Actinomycetota bacterium]|nr:hypothetical protein [Actinomycetota bacterium]
MRCTICSFPQVNEVDVLLSTGTPIRKVAQMYGLARSSVARHRAHIAAARAPFAVIRGQGDPRGTPDPLAEAFLLAGRARTPRERIRALEQVRAATRLRFRGVADLDADDRELLDGNIAQAEAAYRDASDFETAARALSGWREAILQRLDAVKAPEGIDVQYLVVFTDEQGNPSESAAPGREPATFKMPLADYFRGTPKRFHDVERYRVERTVYLQWHPATVAPEDLKVREIATDALVWAKESNRQPG